MKTPSGSKHSKPTEVGRELRCRDRIILQAMIEISQRSSWSQLRADEAVINEDRVRSRGTAEARSWSKTDRSRETKRTAKRVVQI